MARDRENPDAVILQPSGGLQARGGKVTTKEESDNAGRGLKTSVVAWLTNPDEEGTRTFQQVLDKALENGEIGAIIGLIKEAMKETPNVQIAILGSKGLMIPANISTDSQDWVYEQQHGLKLHKPTLEFFLKYGDGVARHPKCSEMCWMQPPDERQRKDSPLAPIVIGGDDDAVIN